MLANANAMLGNGYLQAGDYEAAIEAFTNAIRHDPNFAKAYYMMGMACSCRGEHGRAIGHLSQAIALRADKPSYYFSRAQAYEAMYQAQHAIDDLDKVLMLFPEHHAARVLRNKLTHQQIREEAAARPRANTWGKLITPIIGEPVSGPAASQTTIF